MELTDQQKKIAVIGIAGALVVAAALIAARGFSSYVRTSVPVAPTVSDDIVGGNLKGTVVTSGQHVLEYRARTSDGKTLTHQVTINATGDPYDPYAPEPSSPPSDEDDPYGPEPAPIPLTDLQN